MKPGLSRRKFLTRSGLIGCSLAASPLLTPITLASAPWDARLVVIILRGGMDGLDVVQPWGDPGFAPARPGLGSGEVAGAIDLDGFFALHPALGDLMPLWQAGELGFAHAVSTPYRDKRSHFDGQDVLEAGTGDDIGATVRRDGWLNRMLQTIPGVEAETAFAVGRGDMLLMSGDAPVSNWSPDSVLTLSTQGQRMLELVYHDDPLFRDAVAEAVDLAGSLDTQVLSDDYSTALRSMQSAMQDSARGEDHMKVAEFAAGRLREETRIAAFSLNGWDTHRGQANALRRSLGRLSETLLTLRAGLGDDWNKTTVLAMTEFGRTLRENGTGGTDHGTGGAMIMAGGALRGGRVYTNWPGLGEPDLYQGRDLRPMADVRAYAASALQGLFGLNEDVLTGSVFPGLDMANVPDITL